MRRRRLVTGIVFGVGGLALAGCATPGYNPRRVQSELIRAGTTRAQAECVTQGLSDKIDEKQLGSHSAPSAISTSSATTVTSTSAGTTAPGTTAPGTTVRPATTTTTTPNEYVITQQVLKRCGVTLPLQPPP